MMMISILEWSVRQLLVICLVVGCFGMIVAQNRSRLKHKPAKAVEALPAAVASPAAPEGKIIGQRMKFSDGSALEVDEVWKQGEEFWSRTGGVTQRIDRIITTIEPIRAEPKK